MSEECKMEPVPSYMIISPEEWQSILDMAERECARDGEWDDDEDLS